MHTRNRFSPMFLLFPAALALSCNGASNPPSVVADAAADSAVVDVLAPDDRAQTTDSSTPDDRVQPADAPPADIPSVTDVVDVAEDRVAMVGPYPAGPYGNRQGNVLAPLSWEGYVNLDGADVSTEHPFEPTSMQALRETGRGYALVHLSEFY